MKPENTATETVRVVLKHNKRKLDKICLDGDDQTNEEEDDKGESVKVVIDDEQLSKGEE